MGILDPKPPTRAELSATYVPKWKPNTAYAAGEAILSPAGDTVTAKVAFTSGATYSSANWNLSTSYAGLDVQLSRPTKAKVTQGLYARVVTHGRALATDPSVAGRVWGATSGGISFWDASGGARTDATPLPSTQSPVQMIFGTSFVFLVTSGNADRLGQVWRSPLPAANGTGLVWSKLFDLTGGTTTVAGGVDGGVGSYFREQSFAINGNEGYILEYGGTVTGGPSLYYSANVNVATPSSILWTKRNTWANAKHGHGVAVVGGVPWAMFGDAGFSDLGLWRATASNAGTWNKLSLYGEAEGGNTLYGINIIPVTIDGQPVVITDNDTKTGASVLGYNTQGNIRLPFVPLLRVPMPYHGTVRSLSLTSEGNLMWVQTGEAGAVGALDSIWISKAPFTEPVLLESFPSNNTLSTLGMKVESGNYIFFGTYRITKEKFIGQ
jgi:hypothetical protein